MLVLVPLFGIGVLSAWFVEADRSALVAAREDAARVEARRIATALVEATDSRIRALADAVEATARSAGSPALRNLTLNEPLLSVAVIHDAEGGRLFPPEQEMLIYAEQAYLSQIGPGLAEARRALPANEDTIWSGSVAGPANTVVACRRSADGGSICLAVDRGTLRQEADAFLVEAQPIGSNPVRLANPGDRAAEAGPQDRSLAIPLPAPFAGIVLLAVSPGPTGMAWFGLLAVIAPILGICIGVGALLYWSQVHRETADRQRIEMLAQVSHDLRTPLTNFRLYATLMQKFRARDPELDRYCSVIEAETDRLSGLIDNALACARDGLPPVSHTEKARPDALVRDIMSRYAPLVGDSSPVTLSLAADCESRFDTQAFQQILINLIDNARKHAAGAALNVATALRSGQLELRVSDSGPGLPADVRAALFSAFAPGSASVTGFGLGLAACRALARRAGGDIRYDHGDAGSVFTVTLPAETPEPPLPDPQEAAASCAS